MKNLPSFSQWNRATACPASETLPHVRIQNAHASEGTALHAFMQIYLESGWDRDAALRFMQANHAAYYDAALALPVDMLTWPARAAAEVACRVNLLTGAAEVGVELGGHRAYPQARPAWEVWGTLDVVGDIAGRTVIVRDYKFGFDPQDQPGESWQMRLAAMAVFGDRVNFPHVESVETQIVTVRDGLFHVDPHVFTRAACDAYRQEALAIAAALYAGDTGTPTTGDHCTYCPAFKACPAQVGLLMQLVSGEEVADGLALAEQVRAIDRARKVLDKTHKEMKALALREPIDLGDGWCYGPTASGIRIHRPK
jgi:RecB family exonuclease